MSLIEEELGRVLSTKELSEILGADEKTIRKYYQRLGGIRIGRHYKFFEKEVINAVQTWNEVYRTNKEEQTEKRKGVSDEERSSRLGSQNEAKARKRVEREDKHGLFS